MPATILVIEDEPAIQELISATLLHAGHQPMCAFSAEEAAAIINSTLPDVVLIDWMLPGMSGIQYARKLRGEERTRSLPVILLTARGEEQDKVTGLEAGADDYLTKPFNPRELVARMRAVLRRQTASAMALHEVGSVCYHFGPFVLDVKQRIFQRDGESIHLSSGEFALLRLFLAEAGQPLTRQQLVLRMASREHQPDQRAVDMLVSRLRKRLDEPAAHESMIRTVRGVGYVLVVDVVRVSCA